MSRIRSHQLSVNGGLIELRGGTGRPRGGTTANSGIKIGADIELDDGSTRATMAYAKDTSERY